MTDTAAEALSEGAEAHDQLKSLLAISREMHAGADQSRIFHLITVEAARFLRAERAVLLWQHPETLNLLVKGVFNLSTTYIEEMLRSYGSSAGGLAARLLAPIFIPDVQVDPRVSPAMGAAAAREGIRAYLVLPMIHEGLLTSGLVIYWALPHVLSEGELATGRLFADLALPALTNAFAFEEQKRRRLEAERLAEQRLAELQEASRVINQALEEAMQADMLKGDFLSAVSHELRTPLTSILGYAEFLQDGVAGALSAPQLELVDHIMRATGQLTRLVDDLLDFARMEAGTFRLSCRPLALGPVLNEAVEALRAAAHGRGIALALHWPEALPAVMADAQRVRQVATNLLSNAIKFTEAGGTVTVSAGVAGDTLEVAVADTGIGLSPAQQQRLFEKFYRADHSLTRTTQGTGLGLAIAKQLIEAQGGSISVESREGEGSTFRFRLPLAPPAR